MSVKKAGFGCHPDYLSMTNQRKGLPSIPLPSEYTAGLNNKNKSSGRSYKIEGPTGSAHYKRRAS